MFTLTHSGLEYFLKERESVLYCNSMHEYSDPKLEKIPRIIVSVISIDFVTYYYF